MPIPLQRLTTVYSAPEDRIRISAEDNKGRVVVMWLTQRLLKRMLPALIEWYEKRAGNIVGAEVRQSFAQLSAVSRLKPQPPVASGSSIDAGVIESIDIKRGNNEVRLVLKTRRFEPAELAFSDETLRQWLDIAYRAYLKAEWTGVPWPEWLQETRPKGRSAARKVIH